MRSDEKLEKALNANTDELYALIGLRNNQKLHGSTPNIQELIKQGKAWMAENKEKFQKIICQNDLLRIAIIEKPTLEVAILLKKIIIDSHPLSPDIESITALITKEGLKEYCSLYWKK